MLLKTTALIFGIVLLITLTVFIVIYIKYKFLLSIKAKTIHLQKPVLLANNTTQRNSVANNPTLQNLILQEAVLRQTAYKNTSIKTADYFFDDSDMTTDYFLILIYHKKTNTPLLSARYYFNKTIIAKCLKGDEDKPPILDLNKYTDKQLFLIDRMSANNHSSLYRHHRNYIHLLFYEQLYIHNKTCQFIAMARKQKFEKLLTKYIRLGLNIIGTTKHMGKEHWVLLGDNKKNYTNTKKITLVNMLLLTKSFFLKFKR